LEKEIALPTEETILSRPLYDKGLESEADAGGKLEKYPVAKDHISLKMDG